MVAKHIRTTERTTIRTSQPIVFFIVETIGTNEMGVINGGHITDMEIAVANGTRSVKGSASSLALLLILRTIV